MTGWDGRGWGRISSQQSRVITTSKEASLTYKCWIYHMWLYLSQKLFFGWVWNQYHYNQLFAILLPMKSLIVAVYQKFRALQRSYFNEIKYPTLLLCTYISLMYLYQLNSLPQLLFRCKLQQDSSFVCVYTCTGLRVVHVSIKNLVRNKRLIYWFNITVSSSNTKKFILWHHFNVEEGLHR